MGLVLNQCGSTEPHTRGNPMELHSVCTEMAASREPVRRKMKVA